MGSRWVGVRVGAAVLPLNNPSLRGLKYLVVPHPAPGTPIHPATQPRPPIQQSSNSTESNLTPKPKHPHLPCQPHPTTPTSSCLQNIASTTCMHASIYSPRFPFPVSPVFYTMYPLCLFSLVSLLVLLPLLTFHFSSFPPLLKLLSPFPAVVFPPVPRLRFT